MESPVPGGAARYADFPFPDTGTVSTPEFNPTHPRRANRRAVWADPVWLDFSQVLCSKAIGPVWKVSRLRCRLRNAS